MSVWIGAGVHRDSGDVADTLQLQREHQGSTSSVTHSATRHTYPPYIPAISYAHIHSKTLEMYCRTLE